MLALISSCFKWPFHLSLQGTGAKVAGHLPQDARCPHRIGSVNIKSSHCPQGTEFSERIQTLACVYIHHLFALLFWQIEAGTGIFQIHRYKDLGFTGLYQVQVVTLTASGKVKVNSKWWPVLSVTHKIDATSHRQELIPHALVLRVTRALLQWACMNYNPTGAGEAACTCIPNLWELRQGDLKYDANPAYITCVKLSAFIIKFKQHMVAFYEKKTHWENIQLKESKVRKGFFFYSPVADLELGLWFCGPVPCTPQKIQYNPPGINFHLLLQLSIIPSGFKCSQPVLLMESKTHHLSAGRVKGSFSVFLKQIFSAFIFSCPNM